MYLMWALFLTLGGCSNSGLGRDSGPSGDSGDSTTTSPACPLVGTWDLASVQCGSFPFDEWYDTFESARLDVAVAAGGTGCEVSRVLVGTACRETERMQWLVAKSGGVDVASEGVTTCAPDGCSFPGIGTCPSGARADTVDTLTAVVDSKTGQLEVVDGQPDGTFVASAVDCKLDIVTYWTRR